MLLRRIAQEAALGIARPYVQAELPGWGKVYSAVIGSFRRDGFWSGAPTRTTRNKLYGFVCDWDLSKWADRQAYCLGRWYDLPTQLLAFAVRGRTVVDIGANRGDFSLAVAALTPGAQIVAFEPNPKIAAILRGDLKRNSMTNVEVRECALGDQEDTLTLCVPYENSGSASFGGFVGEGYKVNVPVKVGDHELAELNPDLIKIDVEGFELKTLKGLQKTIERAQPIVETELVEDNLARCGTSSEEVVRFMESLGYTGYGMELTSGNHELALVDLGTTWDAVWLPRGREPSSLKALPKDLSGRSRSQQ